MANKCNDDDDDNSNHMIEQEDDNHDFAPPAKRIKLGKWYFFKPGKQSIDLVNQR